MPTIETSDLKIGHEAHELIRKIVNRFRSSFPDVTFDAFSLSMDLALCSARKYVDLARLHAFDLGDFAHDVNGILCHLDRQTGELTDCFLPRAH